MVPAVAPALPRVYAISAPYSSAALSGGSGGNNVPLVLLKAPFTAAGFTFVKYDIPAFAFPFDQAGRGEHEVQSSWYKIRRIY
jgi:hypothetical protein